MLFKATDLPEAQRQLAVLVEAGLVTFAQENPIAVPRKAEAKTMKPRSRVLQRPQPKKQPKKRGVKSKRAPKVQPEEAHVKIKSGPKAQKWHNESQWFLLDPRLRVFEVAEKVGKKKTSFPFRFKKRFGVNPEAWRTQRGITYVHDNVIGAMEYLAENPEASLLAVANYLQVNPSNLRKAFRKVKGMSPLEWSKAYAENKVSIGPQISCDLCQEKLGLRIMSDPTPS